MNEWCGAEERVAKPARTGLNNIGDGSTSDFAAIVFQDVRFARCDHEAELVSPAQDHAVHEVFAHRSRTFNGAIQAAAHREKFLGESERLDSAACARCW